MKQMFVFLIGLGFASAIGIRPVAAQALKAPSALQARFSGQSIHLTWKAAGDSITAYIIERKSASDGGFELLAAVGDTTGYKDVLLQHNTSYQYRIKSMRQKLESAYSNVSTATVRFDAENLPEETLWVTPMSTSTRPSPKGLSGNTELNAILLKHGVLHYRQALPFARSRRLRSIAEIVFRGDVRRLMFDLSRVPRLVSGLYHESKPKTALFEAGDWFFQRHRLDPTKQDWLWHLSKIGAEQAWDLSRGSRDVTIAVIDTDIDVTHPELEDKVIPPYDPYEYPSTPAYFGAGPNSSHGTSVASLAAGETVPKNAPYQGGNASVGFDCRMIFYRWNNGLKKALHASTVMKACVLSISWFNNCSPDANGYEELIIKEILDNNTIIVAAAGNGNQHCGGGGLFPFSAVYDSRVIVVTSTDERDMHSNINGTHSDYPEVDICAPGYDVMVAMPTQNGSVSWPYYGSASGTSFATPIVAGVCGLMCAVNPCLTPAEVEAIIKLTADPVADALNFIGGVGAGRINAFEAVSMAKNAYNGGLTRGFDLFMRDAPNDVGNEPNTESINYWISPDLWNCQDMQLCVQHENLEFNGTADNNLCVEVHNRGCAPSNPAWLHLYWTRARAYEFWPDHWMHPDDPERSQINPNPVSNWLYENPNNTGPQHPGGGEITKNANFIPDPEAIPALQPGESVTICRSWQPPDPAWYPYGTSKNSYPMICLLARIVSQDDPMADEQVGRISDNLTANNNIVTINTYVTDLSAQKTSGDIATVLLNNPWDSIGIVNISLVPLPRGAGSGFQRIGDAELFLGDRLWVAWRRGGAQGAGFEVNTNERTIRLNADTLHLRNIRLQSGARHDIGLRFAVTDLEAFAGGGSYEYELAFNYDGDSVAGGAVGYRVNLGRRTEITGPAKGGSGLLFHPTLPNPVEDQCLLAFSVPSASRVSLTVFSASGVQVAVLSDEFRMPGDYSLVWDGSDAAGNLLPSGLYFCRLRSETESIVRRIVIRR